MKHYMLFVYSYGKAYGGWHDYVGVFETVDEAVARYHEEQGKGYAYQTPEDYDIVDTSTMERVQDETGGAPFTM